MRLPARLARLLEWIPNEGLIADIGAGDGQLALSRSLRDGSPVIATEYSTASVERLSRLVANHPAGALVSVRKGDGFTPVREGEAQGAVIAGMGGRTIVRILASPPRSGWLILQPVQHAADVEEEIRRRGWRVDGYDVVMDHERGYPSWKVNIG